MVRARLRVAPSSFSSADPIASSSTLLMDPPAGCRLGPRIRPRCTAPLPLDRVVHPLPYIVSLTRSAPSWDGKLTRITRLARLAHFRQCTAHPYLWETVLPYLTRLTAGNRLPLEPAQGEDTIAIEEDRHAFVRPDVDGNTTRKIGVVVSKIETPPSGADGREGGRHGGEHLGVATVDRHLRSREARRDDQRSRSPGRGRR